MNATSLQEQITSLQEQLVALQQAFAQTQQELQAARQENKLLREKLDALARRCFGKKSEQLSSAQLELLLNGLIQGNTEASTPCSPTPKQPSSRRTRNQTQRVRTPDNLEVVQEVIEPKDVETDREGWKRIGEEVSRLLDYQPGKFFWRETVRPKYVRTAQRELPPVIAAAPARVGGLAAPGLLAYLLVSKFSDHLPFYRQQMIFWERHEVFIARQQMVLWMGQSTALLEGIVGCIKIELRASDYVQVDETPVKYLAPGMGRCGQGYLWTGLSPGRCVIYEWHASRAATCLNSLLGEEFAGKLQCDGYSAYPAYARDKLNLTLFGCWAHMRRGFFEAKDQSPGPAGWILNQIGLLYRWEAQLREERAGPVAREVCRASCHRMVVERLHRALIRLQPRHLPQSLLGQAISYALNQWPALTRILEHGEVEWDNNMVENKIRPTAVGKRNWLFFGSEEAGQRNAVIYTLIANCRLHEVEPYEYLKDVLTRLPGATNHQLAGMTPLRWKQERQKPASHAA